MEQKGWLHLQEEEKGGRNKKVYDITGDGWRQLDKWLGKTPEYPVTKGELILKMMVWGISRPNDSVTLIQHFVRGKRIQENF